ncbi:MAG: hypothetical protein AAF990_13880 [Bacteroidota bacterium]
MKNQLTLLLLLITYTTFSQTIGSDWLFSVGDSSQFKKVEINGLFDPGAAGMDVVWDFSNVATNLPQTSETQYYRAAADFGSNSFSALTSLAALSGNSIRYYDLVNDSLIYFGDSTLWGGKRVYEPPIVRFTFPMAFDEEINDSSQVSNFDNLGELAFDTDIEVSRKFDGIGTLITPTHSFDNCIRIKEVFTSQPRSQTPLVYETYSWYFNKLSNEMARVSIQTFLGRSSVEWQTNLNDATTTTHATNIPKKEPLIRYLKNKEFQVKNMDGLFSVTVFDLSGRQIEQQKITLHKEGSYFKLAEQHPSTEVLVALFVNVETKAFFVHKYLP